MNDEIYSKRDSPGFTDRIDITRLLFGTLALLLSVGCVYIRCGSARAASSTSSELEGKIVVGYQGWFGCSGDGGPDGFTHWQRADGGLNVDLLPDLSELAPSDTCVFQPKTSGPAVTVYSGANPAVIDMHFRWMAEYAIDVAAVQRFVSILKSPRRLEFSDRILDEIRQAAERHRRGFFVEYDLSGSTPDDTPLILSNIERLVAGVIRSPNYQRVRGRPLIGLWGLGFSGRPWTPEAAAALIAAVRQVHGSASVMVGVPAYWRTSTRDASSDPAWLQVWPKADVLSPWTVGRFGDDAGAARFRHDVMAPDLQWTRNAGLAYLPTAFPGFSWSNMHKGETPRNAIPRRCGAFLRGQLGGIEALGVRQFFVAMFDENDEGTAVYKTLTSRQEGDVLTLDEDGCETTSDLYLRIIKEETKKARAP